MDTFQTALIDLLPRLRRLARILAWEPADADDLTQLTLERALVRRDQWRDGTRLDSWVFRMMKNAWIDEMRSRQRRARVLAPEELGDSVADPGSATLDARLGVTAVERALPPCLKNRNWPSPWCWSKACPIRRPRPCSTFPSAP